MKLLLVVVIVYCMNENRVVGLEVGAFVRMVLVLLVVVMVVVVILVVQKDVGLLSSLAFCQCPSSN